MLQIDDQLSHEQDDLTVLQRHHLRSKQRRASKCRRERDRLRQCELANERRRQELVATTAMQAYVRGWLVRKFILPLLRAKRDQEELETLRVTLGERLLGVHQTIHLLAFLEPERHAAATRIQSWWRAVIAKRIVDVLFIWQRLTDVYTFMSHSAITIQAKQRGVMARASCLSLRMEREERKLQAKKAETARVQSSVVTIQSHFRRMFAQRDTEARRIQLSKDLEGDTGPGDTESPVFGVSTLAVGHVGERGAVGMKSRAVKGSRRKAPPGDHASPNPRLKSQCPSDVLFKDVDRADARSGSCSPDSPRNKASGAVHKKPKLRRSRFFSNPFD